MRRNPFLSSTLFACGLWLATALLPATASDADKDRAIALAVQTLDRLDAGEYQAIVESFTPEARAAIDAESLSRIWTGLPAQLGEPTGRGEPAFNLRGALRVVVIPLHYERGMLNAIVSLDAHDRVAGLLLQPPVAAPPPRPAAAAGVRETEVHIGSGERALPGTLSLPAPGDGLFPGVVLVHGSGPQDRDETIGPNRPFLDIAHGLAAQGIAVLRYDKRTRARPQDYATGEYGVDDEVTLDAVTAIETLRNTPGIDPQRIYVLGHSLGAMMAPRIAARADTAGAILFAAPSRPLLDILVEQFERMASADGTVSEAGRKAIDGLQGGIARIRAGEDVPASEAPLGQSTTYWRSIEAVDPVGEAKSLAIPLLLLHGHRDIQVTDDDWRGWRDAFADDPRARLKSYPALSHLGIAGTGPGSLVDYQTAGRVDAALIRDIVEWIGQH
ncbi:MAG: alpha/beta fold hydrolase [Luteimonas sp.]|nr:alpha/beta fold hydrolase [Luteimonas sp.]